MNLQESGEMYLETIYILSKQKPYVRSVDVGEYMGYSKPSVSRAMGLLKESGYVVADKNGFLTLTERGQETASKIYERHTVLRDMLLRLGVDEQTASTEADITNIIIKCIIFSTDIRIAISYRYSSRNIPISRNGYDVNNSSIKITN